MNIYRPYLLSLSILLAYSTTLNLLNLCSCSELVNESNCNDDSGCTWNKNTCEKVACSDIQTINECNYVSSNCYWQAGQCRDFINCSSIFGANQQDCKMSNYYCPASNGTNCGPIDQLQTCSAQTNQFACNSYFSQQGMCVWYGGQCVVASSCSQFYDASTNTCQFQGCYLSGTTCLPKTCSILQTEGELCEAGFLVFGPYLQNVIACQWNSAQNICEDFDQSNIDSVDCYLYSYGTFSWSESKSNKGSCQQCFGRLMKIIFLITISLLQ